MKKIILIAILISLSACSDSTTNLKVQCDNKIAIISFNEALLDLHFNNYIYQLEKVVSASGLKYQNDSALVWLKGDDAIIKLNQINFQKCKLIKKS